MRAEARQSQPYRLLPAESSALLITGSQAWLSHFRTAESGHREANVIVWPLAYGLITYLVLVKGFSRFGISRFAGTCLQSLVLWKLRQEDLLPVVGDKPGKPHQDICLKTIQNKF